MTESLNRKQIAARWKPGQSGNPGGRKKGLEKQIRDIVGADVEKMTMAMRDIVLGIKPKGDLACVKIMTRDRIEAYKTLLDRGWGKVKSIVPINESSPGDDLTLLSSAELDELIRTAAEDPTYFDGDEDDDEPAIEPVESAVEPTAEAPGADDAAGATPG
jgi:uncharacterized protein DUF5681